MLRTLCAGLLLMLLNACTPKYQTLAARYQFEDKSSRPNYAQLDYWAAHPYKHDPSDSIPKPLRGEPSDSTADVFFLYPTTYTSARMSWNALINDPYINAKTDYSTILYQASAFNQHARIFAPRYRQAHLSAFFINKGESKPTFDTAYSDLKNAFEFYLSNYNKGRPIIIAGHSQGALMAIRLLREFFDGKPLQRQLVAAYVIGWPVFASDFKNIPVCRDSLQTGCFCSWRTYRDGYTPAYINQEGTAALVTNPLTWRTDDTYAPRQLNKGSVLKKFNEVVAATTDAKVHEGMLWVSKPKFPGAAFFRTKNYHIGDINLFYINLRENVAQRLSAYELSHQRQSMMR